MSGFVTIVTILRLKSHFLKQTVSESAHEIATPLLAYLSAAANSSGTARESAPGAGGALGRLDSGPAKYFRSGWAGFSAY
jgi:hypothetical protein